LIYLALTLPFSIWFLSSYFAGIPKDFEDAAHIDGCSTFQALTQVVIPIALPGLVAAAAFAFMALLQRVPLRRFLTQSIDSQTGPVIISSIAAIPMQVTP
jgi:multiple sugar transport system permease protein